MSYGNLTDDFNENALRSGNVDRPRVSGIFAALRGKAVVSVVAGAGYGKSHALYSYLNGENAAVSWISLSERDNVPAHFWENYINALAHLEPDAADELRECQFPQTKRDFDDFCDVPKRRLHERREYAVVFDDLHVIHERAVLSFIGWSVNTPHESVRKYILSRTPPPFDIAPEEMCGHVSEEELRFSEGEIADFFMSRGVALDWGDAALICGGTNGWALAVSLTCSAMGGHGASVTGALRGIKRNLRSFIETDVLSALSDGARTLLVEMSLIEHLSMDFVEELAGDAEYVRELRKLGTFLRYDEYRDVLRIHRLLLDFLRGKQSLLMPDARARVFDSAGKWCLRNGYNYDAAYYFRENGDFQSVFRIIGTMPILISNSTATSLLDLVEAIPPQDDARRAAELHTLRSISGNSLRIVLRRYDEAGAGCRAAIDECRDKTDRRSLIVAFSCCNMLGFMGYILCTATGKCDFSGYFADAGGYWDRLPPELKNKTRIVGNLPAYVNCVGAGSPCAFDDVTREIEHSERYLTKTVNGIYSGQAALARCELEFFRAKTDLALEYGNQAVAKARDNMQYEIETRALYYILRIGVFNGDRTLILGVRNRIAQLRETPEFHYRRQLCDLADGWFFSQLQLIDYLPDWLGTNSMVGSINRRMLPIEVMVRARWLCIQGKFEAALACLSTLRELPPEDDFLLGRVEADALAAVCLVRMGRSEDAAERFVAAYERSRAEGLEMPFIEIGRYVSRLCAALTDVGDRRVSEKWRKDMSLRAAAYSKRVRGLAGDYRRKYHPAEAAVKLTEREVRILADLYRGLTRQEIAGVHKLSINTVKTVLRELYAKLGAENNVDAVRLALELGIIEASK
jgi:LuxR family maltose regulon positive regulatory protein